MAGYGTLDNAVNVEKELPELLPDNRYAFNYPVKQNYAAQRGANDFPRAATPMAQGFPAPLLDRIPQNGVIQNAGTALERGVWKAVFRPVGLLAAAGRHTGQSLP